MVRKGRVLGMADGILVEHRGVLNYDVSFEGKTVRFQLPTIS